MSALAALATLAASFVLVAPAQVDALGTYEQEILDAINDYRQSLGLDSLVEVGPLSNAALTWSDELMARPVGGSRECLPTGDLYHVPRGPLEGAPDDVVLVAEQVLINCGNTGFISGWSSGSSSFSTWCGAASSQVDPVIQICDVLRSDAIEAITREDVRFIGLGTSRRVVSTNILGDEVRVITTVRFGTNEPCLGYDITIDMNTNGGDGTGTSGRDVILGTPGDDVIDAGDGDDIVCSGGGDDVVEAGDGDDVVVAGDGDDKVFGRRGDDHVDGGAGNDVIHGNKGNDRLSGWHGDDKIFGYADNDTIIGGPGDDRLHGNFGDDVIRGGDGADRMFGYGDDDRIFGGTGRDLITGNFGDDVIYGAEGNDVIFGADGDDVIYGEEGNDRIEGNSLNDLIDGGHGGDTIDGGIGVDVCAGGFDKHVDTVARCETVTNVP